MAQDAGRGRVHRGGCLRSVVLDEVYIHMHRQTLVFLLAIADDGRVLVVGGPTTRTTENGQRVLEELQGLCKVASASV